MTHMRLLLRWLELILTAAGLLVTVAVPYFFPGLTDSPWKTVAWTAIAVGCIHGVLFFLVRSRQRAIREEALAEARGMLEDVGNNQLTIITLLTEARSLESRQCAEATMKAVHALSSLLHDVGEESLQRWKSTHAECLRQIHSHAGLRN